MPPKKPTRTAKRTSRNQSEKKVPAGRPSKNSPPRISFPQDKSPAAAKTARPMEFPPRQIAQPELLAPAGSKASWVAAVENGADAVYLGLNNFSARTYADNFSLAEFAGIIKESRASGVRVYLAMNSLIREGELPLAFRLLATCASMEPDGLILQDLGLAKLAAKYFPQLPRHASTLTAVHSLPGLVTLASAGFSRAVLARELAFDEVEALSTHSPIEVEVFNHGALCFSFSGLCLMSSFLGGRSALRGGCTQPCRRTYQRAGKRGAFFSTTDLCTAPYFNELRRLPISSFKIEGRMKGPDYVSRVVRAYRILLDAPDADWPYALADAENILAEAPSRKTTGGPLAARIEGALAPLNATTSGLKIGLIEPLGPGQGRVTLERAIKVDDRLRLQVRPGEESVGFNLKTITVNSQSVEDAQAGTEAILGSPNFPGQKGLLFKVSSGSEEKIALASPLARAVKEIAKKIELPAPKPLPPEIKVMGRGKTAATDPARLGFWVWLNRAEDMRETADFDSKKIILPLTVPNVRHVRHNKRYLKNEMGRLVWSLPPLIFHRRQTLLMKELSSLAESGAEDFLVSNLGQINMINRAASDRKVNIWGDHRLGVLNHLAEEALIDLGLAGVTLSLEGDSELYSELWKSPPAGRRLLYLYGRPPLFTTRFPLDGRQNAIVSPKGEKFRLSQEGEETIVVAERPVFMAPLLKMPPLPGGVGLIIDLRSEVRPCEKARELKKAITGSKTGLGSSFNFKRKLL